jgi:hypothetical protein
VNGDGETLRYYHDGANVLMEYDDAQTPVLQRYYVHGTGYVDERAVMHDAASEADCYYTLKDLYTVDSLVNNRGHEVERVTYDAYGMPLMKSIHVADVDYSGTVNATDTAAVVANYGLSVGTFGPIYDIDGNGAINATDSGLVSAAYGSVMACAAISPTPPGTAGRRRREGSRCSRTGRAPRCTGRAAADRPGRLAFTLHALKKFSFTEPAPMRNTRRPTVDRTMIRSC